MACNQTLPEDDVRRQALHHRAIKLGIVVVDPGNQRADVGSDSRIVGSFEERALERHRPGRACDAHIGQRLLDTDRAVRPLHDEDEIEIAIPDFMNSPTLRPAAQQVANLG